MGSIFVFFCVLLDGQPPKYNTKNQKTINDSSCVQSHPETGTESPSPPVRKLSAVKSEYVNSSKANIASSMKEGGNNGIGEPSGGILYCEDYAEIVENEEGDYSR